MTDPIVDPSNESLGAPPPVVTPQPFLPLFFVLFAATIVAQLISLAFGRADQQQSFSSIVLPSLVFLSVLTIPSVAVGIMLGRGIGLGSPLVSALLSRQADAVQKLARDTTLAVGLGLLSGIVFLLMRKLTAGQLPADLPALGHRGLAGGLAVSLGAAVGEEVWFRLGLMTLLVWVATKIRGEVDPSPIAVWSIIVVTSVGFGMAHLPQVFSYGAASPLAIAATIVGNTIVGILYGWCYWRRSLIAAMVAHFSVDIVLHAFAGFLG